MVRRERRDRPRGSRLAGTNLPRILHFTDQDDTSGYFQQLARHHDRVAFPMAFGTLRPMPTWLQEAIAAEGVSTFSCGAETRAGYPQALLRLARLLRERRIDVIHTHLFDPSVVGLVAALLSGTSRRVMTRHYSDYHTRIHKRWHVRIDKLCNALSHAIVAVSHHVADHLVRVEGAPAAKVHTIWNGVDFDRVRFSSPDAPFRVRKSVGGEGKDLLLVVGRLHPEKGYDTLFQALPEIRRRVRRPFLLLVAGTGALEDRYRAQVRGLGCDDVVRFLGFRRDVADVIGAADLLVLPSVAEAFGLVLVEALHLGTPVVASRVGGIPEIVEDGVDGVLVPPGDAGALANALAALVEDPERRRRLAGAGAAKVRERFSFPRMVRAYEAVYARLLAQAER